MSFMELLVLGIALLLVGLTWLLLRLCTAVADKS
jgi:hypothetical protein